MTRQTWMPAYIALGSNQNNPLMQLHTAIKAIAKLENVIVAAKSSFYQSEPYGPIAQEEFVNAVIAVITKQNPDELMQSLLDIELCMGRKREIPWGPRIIDLDLLIYSHEVRDSDFLKLPHPELSKRNFVLLPLHDIAPSLRINGLGRVSDLLAKCVGGQIQRIDSKNI